MILMCVKYTQYCSRNKGLKTAKFIRIMNNEGKFSAGGMCTRFTKKGKTWSALGYVKAHLNQYSDKDIRENYKNCTLVVVDEDNNYKKTISSFTVVIEDYIIERKVKQQKKEISNIKAKKQYYKQEIKKLEEKIRQLKDINETY